MSVQDESDQEIDCPKSDAYMPGANNCALPMAHHDIVSILETIRARAITDALLALLELFEQSKITRN